MAKVRITLVADVDVEAWNAEYGDEETLADVRESIRQLALDGLRGNLSHLVRSGAVGNITRADWEA